MQTVERTFSVLRAIAESDASTGVSEIARRTGLAKSTASRILASLDDLGMVDRLNDRYVIGQGLAALTQRASPVAWLRDVARPYLIDLTAEFDESVALGVLDNDEMLYIDTAESNGAVQVQDWTGHRFPPHTVAAGLVLMLAWSSAEVDAYGRRDLERFTGRTVASLGALRSRMKQVRVEGVAWTMGEFDEEINGAAAPIVDPTGTIIGAINVSGPTYRFPGKRNRTEIEHVLTTACGHISSRL